MKTGEPFVEHEPDGFDVTAPLHDATGKLIGALGIDFKPQPGQTKADVLKLTAGLLKEVEQQIPSKAFLFQPVSAD
jgi:DNA-binding IclR family transcriptional regulator